MCFEIVASVQPGSQPNDKESTPKNDDDDDDDDLGIMDVDDNKKTGKHFVGFQCSLWPIGWRS